MFVYSILYVHRKREQHSTYLVCIVEIVIQCACVRCRRQGEQTATAASGTAAKEEKGIKYKKNRERDCCTLFGPSGKKKGNGRKKEESPPDSRAAATTTRDSATFNNNKHHIQFTRLITYMCTLHTIYQSSI